MIYAESLIQQVVSRLQHWNGVSSLYAFAAVTVTYLFVCGSAKGDA